jgi:DHA3 family macrolide efflux protein-like MFS transporter
VTTKPQLHTFREVLAIPGIRRLWIGQLVSITGDFLAIFAVLSIASFRMHGTPAQITGVTISYMLPLAILSPLAGVFADRWNPRHTMIVSDLTRAVLVLLLVFAKHLVEIYAVLFIMSTVSTFFIPAQSVIIRTLVPREGLLSVNAMMQQAMLVLRILSPALAGALVAKFGPGSCFSLDTLSFFFSALMLRGVALPQLAVRAPNASRTAGRPILADLLAGIRFILTHPSISFVMIAMASATFAISCFSPLIAVFVRDILQADVRVFGAVSAMIGLGMIAGTQTVRRFVMRSKRSPRHVVLFSLAVISSGTILIGAAGSPLTTAIGAFVMGVGVGLLMVPAQTLIQSETPLPMIGRVSSGVMSLISVAQILGLILSGVLAAAIGLRPLFFSSAALLAGLALAGYWKLSVEKIASTHLTELNTVN